MGENPAKGLRFAGKGVLTRDLTLGKGTSKGKPRVFPLRSEPVRCGSLLLHHLSDATIRTKISRLSRKQEMMKLASIDADACNKTETIEIPAKGENLARVRHFVKDFACRCGFSSEEMYDIVLAVGEAISNSVEHGSPGGEKSTIVVTCGCRDDDLVVQVADEGVFQREMPELETEPDASYRGRGIFLMLALMDKVSIDESKRGTTVFLSKKRLTA